MGESYGGSEKIESFKSRTLPNQIGSRSLNGNSINNQTNCITVAAYCLNPPRNYTKVSLISIKMENGNIKELIRARDTFQLRTEAEKKAKVLFCAMTNSPAS